MVTNESHPTVLQNGNGNGHYPPLTYVAPTVPYVAPAVPSAVDDDDEIDLSQILRIIRRRLPLIVGVGFAVTLGVGVKLLTEEPVYEGKFDLLMEPVTGQQSLPTGLQALQQQFGGDKIDLDTRVEVLKSAKVINPVLEDIQSRYPDVTYSQLVSNNNEPGKLSIERLKNTQILTVSYDSSDPEEIEYVLTQIAKGYLDYSLSGQQFSTQQGLQFVQQQLPEVSNRVDSLQKQLQTFRQQYNLINPEVQGQEVVGRLNSLLEQRQQTQVSLGETKTHYQSLSQQLGLDLNQSVAISALSEAPRYQSLLNQLQEVEVELAKATVNLTPNNPTIVALQEQRQNLIPLLNQEAAAVLGTNPAPGTNTVLAASPNSFRSQLTQDLIATTNELLTLNARQQALGAVEAQMRQQVQQMAVVARQYSDLQRELEIATERLKRFITARQELEIQQGQTEQPWQVISEIKVPSQPTSPALPKDLIPGALAGIVIGIGAAFLFEALDNTFHSSEELQNTINLPILGVIPKSKNLGKGAITKDDPIQSKGQYGIFRMTEAFRFLYTNLSFLSPDQPIRSVVVTSSTPLEGKSTIAENLARTAAAMGRRVLLVDADLRNPEVHLRLDVSNVWGLSHLFSTDMNVDDVIQKSSQAENLYVLTAGQIPPDPTALVASQKMKSLVQIFQNSFDLVIFDTPPTLEIVDAKVLGAYTDGMLMVVGLSQTKRSAVKSAVDEIRLSPAKLLGIVGNGVKSRSQTSAAWRQ
jgi:capsular exopolysaccharide synthesis family protein